MFRHSFSCFIIVLLPLLFFFSAIDAVESQSFSRSKAPTIHFGPGPGGNGAKLTIHFGPGPGGNTNNSKASGSSQARFSLAYLPLYALR